MQKIELTPETVGLIKDKLAKATAGMFMHADSYNQKPPQLNIVFNEFTITAAKKVEVVTYKKDFKPVKHKTELIHLAFDASTETHYVYGDVFYFKEKQIYVDSKKDAADMQSRVPGVRRDRFVERFTILKYDHELTSEDIKQSLAYHEEMDEVQREFVEFSVNEITY